MRKPPMKLKSFLVVSAYPDKPRKIAAVPAMAIITVWPPLGRPR